VVSASSASEGQLGCQFEQPRRQDAVGCGQGPTNVLRGERGAELSALYASIATRFVRTTTLERLGDAQIESLIRSHTANLAR
jgi:hypothetical protein